MAILSQVILQLSSNTIMYSGIFRAGLTTELDLNALRRSLDNSCNIADWSVFTIDEIIVACHQLKPDE